VLLAIDIGNTNTTFGLFDGSNLVADFRLRSERDRTGDEYASLLASLLFARNLTLRDVTAVSMAYVVPPVGSALRDLSERYFGVEPLVVTSETDTGLTICYDPPQAVGADRIVNAFAARALYAGGGDKTPPVRSEGFAATQGFAANDYVACVVVDYGTATTLDAVSSDGRYLGGAIMPGVGISLDALFKEAALLSRVELIPPAGAIGANTADALRSGILFGYAEQTDGMIARFLHELGDEGDSAVVIATGGIAPLIAPHAAAIEIVDVNLTLTGLRLLHERAARKANP